jgi:hypothetical protein
MKISVIAQSNAKFNIWWGEEKESFRSAAYVGGCVWEEKHWFKRG